MFIAGGFNGQECLNTAECFDPKTRQWTMIAPMRNRRSGIGVVAHDGCVYAVGGFNGITRMNNGEKYSPATNAWTNITEMYSPRSNFGIEVGRRPLHPTGLGSLKGAGTLGAVCRAVAHWVGSQCILPTQKNFPTYIQSTEQTN